jgi:FOG: EAL domain
MKTNQDDEKIVALIIELAHKFGLKVVAEGIESRQVLIRLQELGCDIGQGFYLAKPMTINNFNSWLSRFPTGGARAPE